MTSKVSNNIVSFIDWDPKNNTYMAPCLTDYYGKHIPIKSNQTNQELQLITPFMMTWGIEDFNGDKKYKISLNFPNQENKTKETDMFLQKMKNFENQIMDDAVANSHSWFGGNKSRELVKHAFCPILKYKKFKDTNKDDLTSAPSFSAKVPFYGDRWDVELYDTNSNMIFPSDKKLTPIDLVPKMSKVACILQCSGIWIGVNGRWGVSWKLIQCVVKPETFHNVQPNKITGYFTNGKSEKQQEQVLDYTPVSIPIEPPIPEKTIFEEANHDTEAEDEEVNTNIPISSTKKKSVKRTKTTTQIKKKTAQIRKSRTPQYLIQAKKEAIKNTEDFFEKFAEIERKCAKEKEIAEKKYKQTMKFVVRNMRQTKPTK